MNGAKISTAGGFLLAPGNIFFHTSTAVPADDSCATIGWQVSVRFSTTIFQLQLNVWRSGAPATSSRPTGERSTMLSMLERLSPKYSRSEEHTSELSHSQISYA